MRGAVAPRPNTKEEEERRQAEQDDWNVRRYSFHIYFAYCVALYTVVGVCQVYDPELVLRVYYGELQPLTPGGIYYARHAGALVLVMGLLTAFAWASKSGPVRDLIIKVHFAHHFTSLIADYMAESEGFISKQWQHALFTPHPFFTVLILFLWMTDKRRDLRAEERERKGL